MEDTRKEKESIFLKIEKKTQSESQKEKERQREAEKVCVWERLGEELPNQASKGIVHQVRPSHALGARCGLRSGGCMFLEQRISSEVWSWPPL